MTGDIISIMINEAVTPLDIASACTVVKSQRLTGRLDSDVAYHLMARTLAVMAGSDGTVCRTLSMAVNDALGLGD